MRDKPKLETNDKRVLAAIELLQSIGEETSRKNINEITWVSLRTISQCVYRLKQAGLIHITRRPGKSPLYTIIEDSAHGSQKNSPARTKRISQKTENKTPA